MGEGLDGKTLRQARNEMRVTPGSSPCPPLPGVKSHCSNPWVAWHFPAVRATAAIRTPLLISEENRPLPWRRQGEKEPGDLVSPGPWG